MVKKSQQIKLAFTGVFCAGKDYALDSLDVVEGTIEKVGFADPLYKIAENYLGTSDKTVPGVRGFLQKVGAWGRGVVNHDYPKDVERATFERIFMDDLLSLDIDLDEDVAEYIYRHWGEESIWMRVLQIRSNLKRAPILATTNARFDLELDTLKDIGYTHYHVMCSPETRRERFKAKGIDPTAKELNDITERMAIALDENHPKGFTIWNDEAPVPAGCITVSKFHEIILAELDM